MDFIYYIIRKKDNVILDGATDMVNAINMAQKQNCACLIMQGCIITEVGEDLTELNSNFEDTMSQEIIESDTESEMVAEIIE